MATNTTNTEKNIINVTDDGDALPVDMPVFENPAHPAMNESMVKESDIYNIDITCDMVNNAVQKRNDNIAEAKQNAENKKKQDQDKMEEDKRISVRNACIEKAKNARRARKKLAKNLTFVMVIVSALCSTIVFGILIRILLDIPEWLFAGIVGAIGMLNTLIHTYVYRYIREEIFRK